MASGRRIQFEGDDVSYIRFLEARVLELEKSIQQSSQRVHVRRTPFPESHGDSSRATSRRQVISESENSIQGCQDDGTRLASTSQSESRRCEFEIIEYIPSHNANLHLKNGKQGAESQSAKRQLQMLSNFTSFIRDLPTSIAWKDWVSVSNSQRERLIRRLVEGFASTEVLKELPCRLATPTNLAILHEYGNSMKTSSTTDRQLTCFRELIFCSMCAVALRSAKSKDDVYEAMRGVFGSDAHSKTFETLVRGAKWANRAISLLSHTRWALRSWDIVLVAARQTSFYARFSDYSIEPEQILEELGTYVHDNSYLKDTTNISVPLAIPMIIRRIFKNSTSLEEICECLGYKFSDIRSLQVPFDRVFDSHNNVKRRRRPKQPQYSKRRRQESVPSSSTDCALQRKQSTPAASLGNNFHVSFENVPNLSDSVPGQAPVTVPQAGETAPQAGGPAPHRDEFGTSNALASTYPNPQLGEPAARGDESGVIDAWFSTYPIPQLGEPAAQGNESGTIDAWFSTYMSPQMGEPAARGDESGVIDAWFSTFPNPQLNEATAQGDESGTIDAWLSTYPNFQLGEPAAQTDPRPSQIDCGDS